MATFAVFMHTMLSAALDTSFLASIVQNEEGTSIPVYTLTSKTLTIKLLVA